MKKLDSHSDSHLAVEADLKAFLDRELPFWRRQQVRRHLKNCPHCREEIHIMQSIETELQAELEPETAAPLGADLRARILENAPLETLPKASPIAPPARRRLTPQLVFGLGSLAVFGALILFPVFGGRARENARRSTPQMDARLEQAKSMDGKLSDGEAAVAGAVSAGAAASSSSRQRGQADFYRQSRQLDGAGNGIYSDIVVPAQRQVHKQGSISVAVDDAEAKGSATEILIKNVGGFVAQNALSTAGDGRKTATLDVRVPVAQFETVVAKIGKLGTVREKSVNGEDITQRVTLAGAQRQSLARELSIREAQLRAANPKKAAQKAAIVADVRALRFQANQARARLDYLRKYAALATLFVTLQDKTKTTAAPSATGSLHQTARAAWSSFLLAAQLPLQLLIWIAAYAPLWIPALIVWRRFGRNWMSAN